MKAIIKRAHCAIAFSFMLFAGSAQAQAPGSIETYEGLSITSGGSSATLAETVNIGPGTYRIDGIWEIYSKNVVVDPNAIINGEGSIVFYNPSIAGGASNATLIDGNGSENAIAVNIVLQNAAGAQLTNINFSNDLTISGFTNSTINNLYAGKDLSLAIDGANVDLNGNDLILNSTATISNYDAQRLIITDNSVAGHLVKQSLSGSFVFPIGIAKGDYTPATVIPVESATIHISVQDYTPPVPPIANIGAGMNRTWNIYADMSAMSTLTLQHNDITNGTSYQEEQSYITDYTAGNWSINGATDYISDDGSTSVNTKSSVHILSNPGNAWYSITNNQNSSLPVTLVQPLKAILQDCNVTLTWATGTETNFDHFTLYASTDGKDFGKVIDNETAKEEGGFYSFTQTDPANGTNYYKLSGTDKDGSVKDYGIVSINVGCTTNQLAVYPNPTAGYSTIIGIQSRDMLKIYNSVGQAIAIQTATSSKSKIDLSKNAPDIYFIKVIRNNTTIGTIKVIRK
ncbi:MAG: T9SS type A sorting domain-containing protein [Arachidicoccus sp.]|nr:T9SS type A sorting domain-containing protein [Arachidicoccus sp.]